MTDGPAPGLTTAAGQWNGVERLFSRPGEPSRCWCPKRDRQTCTTAR